MKVIRKYFYYTLLLEIFLKQPGVTGQRILFRIRLISKKKIKSMWTSCPC